jgi:hypothetical protein
VLKTQICVTRPQCVKLTLYRNRNRCEQAEFNWPLQSCNRERSSLNAETGDFSDSSFTKTAVRGAFSNLDVVVARLHLIFLGSYQYLEAYVWIVLFQSATIFVCKS